MKKYYCNKDKMITYICRNDFKYFLNKSYVVGVGLGYKRKNNFYTCEKCIQVYVTKKLPKGQIAVNDLIPLTYKGIKSDVVECGRFTQASLRRRIRPVKGGYSIASEHTTGDGTDGCLVTNGVLKFILSVSHILSMNNELPIGYAITQPADAYGGRAVIDTIAKLHKYIPIRFARGGVEPINLTDVALGEVINPSMVTSEIAFVGKITCVKSPRLNSNIKKVGSATELTQGVITGVGVTVQVGFGDEVGLFSDAVITTKIGDFGDSGALILNNNNCGIGILFGTAQEANVICRLDTALDQLDVHLVN